MQSASSLDARWPDLVAAVSAVIDLDATARASGALVRRRGVRSAATLLRLALAYGPGGLSLRSAATRAGVHGLADLSDTAGVKRLRKAADWLGEIAGALLRGAAAAPAVAGPLPGRRLRIADGSVIPRPGGKGAGWRLHATYDPVAGRLTDLDLTDDRGAEGFGHTAWRAGDVALAHRVAGRGRGARRPLLRPPPGAAAALGSRRRLHRPDRLGAAAPGRGRRSAAGLGAALRRPGAGRGHRAGGRGRLLRAGRQVPRQGGVPGQAHRPAPAAGGGGAGDRGRPPQAPAALRAAPAAAAHRPVRRLPDAGHLATALGDGGRGARGVPAQVAGGTRVPAAQRAAWPWPPARQGRGARPQLAARASHFRPADRGCQPGSPGRSPLRGRGLPGSPGPSRSGASRRRCATRRSPPSAAC